MQKQYSVAALSSYSLAKHCLAILSQQRLVLSPSSFIEVWDWHCHTYASILGLGWSQPPDFGMGMSWGREILLLTKTRTKVVT